MWYPSTVVTPPTWEPVTLAEAKEQCGVLDVETHFNALLTRLIKTARSESERYCNAVWAEQTIASPCSDFHDLARLPHGPLKSVVSIGYVDLAGGEQVVDDTAYEVRKDGLEPAIVVAHGQAWPRIRHGSRITLTAVYGEAVPEVVQHAMLMMINHWFVNREAVVTGTIATTIPLGVDALLANDRRGA